MLLALLWYEIDARHWFKGPKINVEQLIHFKVVEGREAESDRDRDADARDILEGDEKKL
jgi:hypothetical protein